MSRATPLTGVSTVVEAFEAQALLSPAEPAVIAGTQRLSYADLDARAERLAAALRAIGVGPDHMVGVCLQRDAWLIPALLAVWKTGSAWIPLDPAYPAPRLRLITDDARLACVVASTATRTAVPDVDAPILLVDDLPDLVGAVPTPGVGSGRHELAYVLYTSGSTGRPKGVAIEHGNVLALLRWAVEAYSADELAGSLAAASISFDFSILEIFAPLCAGGTVVLAENLLALPALPARDRVGMICAVPSALSVVLDLGLPDSVRTVNTGGEVLTGGLRDRLFRQPGVRRVVNVYGPTECTTACLAHEVRPDEPGEPPIGSPIAGARLTVRDPHGSVVADGVTGELWISGPGVSRGYLNRPDLTTERFVTDGSGERGYRSGDLVRLADGVFHYVGRLDDQVKIRGHRVELGEVHAYLATHPHVRCGVVVAPDDDLGTRRLVAYVELDKPVPEAELRAYLAARLPGFMVPERVVALDRLPLRPNGKADRNALPTVTVPVASTVESDAPTDPVEARIAADAADLLGRPDVGARTPLPENG
jgi:amino acid adenylation domain-containing protein